MIAAIRTYLVAFLATLLGTLTASPIWAAPEFPTPIYTYNALAHSAPRDNGGLERGPPCGDGRDTSQAAVNRGSTGASSRTVTSANYNYTSHGPPAGATAQDGSTLGTSLRLIQLVDGDLLSAQRGVLPQRQQAIGRS